jgi:hypothetical protein
LTDEDRVRQRPELNVAPERIGAFYDLHWPRKISLALPDFYKWQFQSLPTAKGIDNCMVAVERTSGAIAGVMGLHARPFHLAGRRVSGAELTSWVVDERFRAAGAGALLLSEVQKRYDVLIGMGISASALPVYLRSGFKYLKHIPRFVRVLDFEKASRFARFAPLAAKLARSWLRQDHVPFNVTEGAEALLTVPQAWPEFNCFVRDARHLAWRYLEHPNFRYRIFSVSPLGGSAKVLVAVREELSVPGLRLLRVLDLLGDATGVPAALSFLDDYCRRQDMHVADFFCTSSQITRFHVARGWFSSVDHDFFEFPHLFHPLELRVPPTTSLVYMARMAPDEMCDLSRLYVTMSDADLDRPVPTP